MKEEAEAAGLAVVPLSGFRVETSSVETGPDAVAAWRKEHPSAWSLLLDAMGGCTVVVNAAGRAEPAAASLVRVWGANVLLPQVLAEAAHHCGVTRMVHVSSAAVQGSRLRLDESRDVEPSSPYAESKAVAEAALLDRRVACPPEVVVYRPTSVLGEDNKVTRRFSRLARLPVLPLIEDGDAPLPVALPGNVAAAVVHLVQVPAAQEVVLHPWELMTVRTTLEAFGSRCFFVHLPPRPSRFVLRGTRHLLAGHASLHASFRRYELMILGQIQDARHLSETGFVLPYGPEGYVQLARQIHHPR
ncbi:MAG: hypothetical protein QOG43_3324 [Actinomycetota bacterium]|nr:hypothetical protein [Actinomycetota bacterium]